MCVKECGWCKSGTGQERNLCKYIVSQKIQADESCNLLKPQGSTITLWPGRENFFLSAQRILQCTPPLLIWSYIVICCFMDVQERHAKTTHPPFMIHASANLQSLLLLPSGSKWARKGKNKVGKTGASAPRDKSVPPEWSVRSAFTLVYTKLKIVLHLGQCSPPQLLTQGSVAATQQSPFCAASQEGRKNFPYIFWGKLFYILMVQSGYIIYHKIL